MTQAIDSREFQLRAEIERYKEESGALRMALIRLLQETPRDAMNPEAVAKAYQALSGGSNG